MKQNHIDSLLDATIPEADSNAKKIAINSALAKFSEEKKRRTLVSTQHIDRQDTPTLKSSIWTRLLTVIRGPNTGRVFATIAIGFISFAVVDQMPKHTMQNPEISAAKPELESDASDQLQTIESPTFSSDMEEPIEPSNSNSDPDSDLSITIEIESQSRFESVTIDSQTTTTLEETAVSGARAAQAPTNAQQIETKKVEPRLESLSKTSAKPQSDSSALKPRLDTFSQAGAALTPMARQKSLGDQYTPDKENQPKLVEQAPAPTVLTGIDTNSYRLLRNQLQRGFLPAPAAVRTEEVINYFSYNYPYPESKSSPLKASVSVLDSPWNQSKKLIHIGIKAYSTKQDEATNSNLVFLVDISDSMNVENKLPMLKHSINTLLSALEPTDTISIVVYSGTAKVALEPTQVINNAKILSAFKRINAGGIMTDDAAIARAYQLAEERFKHDARNKIILVTDGTHKLDQQHIVSLRTIVKRKPLDGVLVSILAFGRNRYHDDVAQHLMQNDNGSVAYINSFNEANKVLLDHAKPAPFTPARDVNLELAFNPQTVRDYRLVGYQAGEASREGFSKDKADAISVGSGHTITAIYEITPSSQQNTTDSLSYQEAEEARPKVNNSNEYGLLKIRYKLPNNDRSKLIEKTVSAEQTKGNKDVAFSIAAASFAEYLKGGKYISGMSLDDIANMARLNKGDDPHGYRQEFIQLVELARSAAKP